MSALRCVALLVVWTSTVHAFSPVTGQSASSVIGQTSFTTGASGTAFNKLSNPEGTTIDPTTGKLFVVDTGNHRILRFASTAVTISDAYAECVLGAGQGTSATQMNRPRDAHVDSAGRLWVADWRNNRVLRFDNASSLVSGAPANGVFGQPDFTTAAFGSGATGMNGPESITGDNFDNIWVADTQNSRVLRFKWASTMLNGASAFTVLGAPDFDNSPQGATPTTLTQPRGVHVDHDGRLWVSDSYDERVLRFDNAIFLQNGAPANGVLGQPDLFSGASGTTATTMRAPYGISTDSSGRLFVADRGNSRVLSFDAAATLPNGAAASAVLGQPDFTSSGFGLSSSQFFDPTGAVPVPAFDVLLVIDPANNRVLRFGGPAAAPATRHLALTTLALLLGAAGIWSARKRYHLPPNTIMATSDRMTVSATTCAIHAARRP
jgi:sugar lactone lactonase YvrE